MPALTGRVSEDALTTRWIERETCDARPFLTAVHGQLEGSAAFTLSAALTGIQFARPLGPQFAAGCAVEAEQMAIQPPAG